MSGRRSSRVLIDGIRSSSMRSATSSSRRWRARYRAASMRLWVWATSGMLPARAVDLRRVLVRVRGVDLEPLLDRVRTALRVRAGALPFVVGQPLEDLEARLARP